MHRHARAEVRNFQENHGRLPGGNDAMPRSPSPRPSLLGGESPERDFSRTDPLNRRGRTSNNQHPTSNIQWLPVVASMDVGCWMLVVGCSRGSGAGGAAVRSGIFRGTEGFSLRGRRFSLSPGEKAGVRGNGACRIRQCAPKSGTGEFRPFICRAGRSPRRR
jgi:hypothetical protein